MPVPGFGLGDPGCPDGPQPEQTNTAGGESTASTIAAGRFNPLRKLVPQAEQTGMYRQRIPAESLGGRLLGEIQNAQEVSFQVGPAELRLALVNNHWSKR